MLGKFHPVFPTIEKYFRPFSNDWSFSSLWDYPKRGGESGCFSVISHGIVPAGEI